MDFPAIWILHGPRTMGRAAFATEFESVAGFNPMAKCFTIASACNLYWRKHCLQEGLYVDRVRTNWRLGTKDQSGNQMQALFFHGKCIEIHIGYEKETGKANRCGE